MYDTFIKATEAQKIILEWIGSDEYNKVFENANCNQTNDFKSGAMWGAAMAGILIATKTPHYNLSPVDIDELLYAVEDKMIRMCGCTNCIENIKRIIMDDNVPIKNYCSECKIECECNPNNKNE